MLKAKTREWRGGGAQKKKKKRQLPSFPYNALVKTHFYHMFVNDQIQ